MDRIVGEQFRLRRRIGAGSFGEIFSAENIQSHRRVAVKLESTRAAVPQLSYESRIYSLLAGGTGIPRLYWYGTDEFQNVMVIELLDKSLEDLLEMCDRKLSLKTVLMIVDQTLACVEFIHNKNLIHRDIKPDNFVMGLGNNASQVFVIDFGLAKRYRDPNTHEHCRFVEGKSLTGTARYASVRALDGCEQSRRDDLESLGYVWIYLLRGNLPWMGLNIRDADKKYAKICEMKKSTSFEQLCAGFPDEFVRYFYAVRELRFTETPKYSQYRKMFRDLFIRCGFVYDCVYDWTARKAAVKDGEERSPARKVVWNEQSRMVQRSTLAIVRSQPNLLDHKPPSPPSPPERRPSEVVRRQVSGKKPVAEAPKQRVEQQEESPLKRKVRMKPSRYASFVQSDRSFGRTANEQEFKVHFARQTKPEDTDPIRTPRRTATEQRFSTPQSGMRVVPNEESTPISLRSTKVDVDRPRATNVKDAPMESYLQWRRTPPQRNIRQTKSTSYFPGF